MYFPIGTLRLICPRGLMRAMPLRLSKKRRPAQEGILIDMQIGACA